MCYSNTARYLLFFISSHLLSNCTCDRPKASSEKSEKSAQSSSESKGVDFARKSIALNFVEEPRSLDPQKATDTVGLMILHHIGEGLMRLDPNNKAILATAESFEQKSPTEYHLRIKPLAKWSDGKNITAQDFVYGWRRAVDPKTASEYAFFLYKIKNGEAINKGQKKTEELGVQALDDKTLVVQLESPTIYFLSLLCFPTFFPARQDYVEKFKETFASDFDKMPFSGPFTITQWNHNSSLVLTKNPAYWNKDAIFLNEINFPYLIKDENSEYNMFKDRKYALTYSSPKEVLPDALAQKYQIRSYNAGSAWYFEFNTTRKISGNKNLRKAIHYALNRDEYVSQVNGLPGTKPLYGLIPAFMPGDKTTYGEEFGAKHAIKPDLKKAREFFELAKKELALPEIKISLLINDTASWRRDAEYYQRSLKESLGLEIQIDIQAFKVRLDRTNKKDYDMTLFGWGPDYLDPMTYADLLTGWNANNASGWQSKAYDEFVRGAATDQDAKHRLENFFAAEKILLEDLPFIPIFEQMRVYFQDPKLTGVIRAPVGPDPNFYYARISE